MSMGQNQSRKSAQISSTKKSTISEDSKALELRKKGDLKEAKTKDSVCAQSKETIAATCLKRKSSSSSSAQICEEKKFKCQTLGKKTDNSYSLRKIKNDGIHGQAAKVDKRLSENVKLNAVASVSGKRKSESNSHPGSHNHENRKKLTAKRKYSPSNSCENISRNNSRSNLVSNTLSANNSLSLPNNKQRYKIPKTQSQDAPSSHSNRTNEENVLKDIGKKKGLIASAKYESKNTTKLSNANSSIPSNSKVDSRAVSPTSESAFKRKSIQETKSMQLKTSTTISKPFSSSHNKVTGTEISGHEVRYSSNSHVNDYPAVPSIDTKRVSLPRQTIDHTSASCLYNSNCSEKTNVMGYTRESKTSMALSKDSVFTADKQYNSTHFSNPVDNNLNFDISNMNSNQNSNTDTVDEHEVEFMDVDEEVILTNLQEVRNQTSHIFNPTSGSCLDIATTDAHNKEAEGNEKPKSATIIVDTNVLITNLGLIKELLKTDIPEFGKPYILLPWVVMQELDYLKRRKTPAQNSNNATSYKAADAIRFIHTQLMAQNTQLIGQTAYQAKEQSDIPIECNDDRILHCCIQTMKKEGENLVLLLTRDINLINKAVIMSINAADTQTLWSKLNMTQDSCVKKTLLSQVTSSSVNGNSVSSTAGKQLTSNTASRNVQADSNTHNQHLTLSAVKTNRHFQQESFVQNQSPIQKLVNTQSQYLRPTDAKKFPDNQLTTPTTGRNFSKESFTQNQRPMLPSSGNSHCESLAQNQRNHTFTAAKTFSQSQHPSPTIDQRPMLPASGNSHCESLAQNHQRNHTFTAAKTFSQSQHPSPTETITISNNRQQRPSPGRNFQPESSLQNRNPSAAETFTQSQQQRPTVAETFTPNQHQRPSAAETFTPNQRKRPSAAETFTPNQHQRPSAAKTFTPNQHQRPSAAETFTLNQHQRPTAAETFTPNQHLRPSAAETFNPNQHQRPPSGNNVLPDGSTQSRNQRPTENESQQRNVKADLKISTETQKKNVIRDPPVDDADALVLAKFESVWKIIFDVKQQVSSILSQGQSHADFQAAIEMCQRIRTISSQLKDNFHSCLSLSPVILGNHVQEFERFSFSLNSFYRDAQLACADPAQSVSFNQLINHFKQGKNRSLLSTGYEQLVTFIEDYQNLHLNYTARPSGSNWPVTG